MCLFIKDSHPGQVPPKLDGSRKNLFQTLSPQTEEAMEAGQWPVVIARGALQPRGSAHSSSSPQPARAKGVRTETRLPQKGGYGLCRRVEAWGVERGRAYKPRKNAPKDVTEKEEATSVLGAAREASQGT